MDLILCHTTADFDTLGAAVGLTRLHPGARIVLAGGLHPAVRDFLALHRDEYPLIERRSVNPERVRSLIVVDTQQRSRLGKVAEWLDCPGVGLTVYDHHLEVESDLRPQTAYIEAVGAVTTLVVEQLQAHHIQPTAIEATVMALGIHVDTGSLTFAHTTPRDARALAWLMEQQASLRAIADYIDPGLSSELQELLTVALETLQTETIQGYTVAWVLLELDHFLPGLSGLASRLMDLLALDALLLGARYHRKLADGAGDESLSVIGRSRIDGTNLSELFQPIGGGGHPRAAAANLHHVQGEQVLAQLVAQFNAQLPQPPTARDLMSSPVRTIRPETTIAEAQRILLRYGHSGLSVVDELGQLLGIISRRDIDIALHHGFSHAPVKGYMTTNLKTITPDTLLPEIEALMVTYDVGRLPVMKQGHLIGIVTRTDVLRQLHQQSLETYHHQFPERRDRTDQLQLAATLLPMLRQRLIPELWELLAIAAQEAEQRGWQLYLVGGAVRDVLLTRLAEATGSTAIPPRLIEDIDLVVDGFHEAAETEAGVALARSLQARYPQARLDIHGKFQTAALLWHNDPIFQSLWVDVATARTEFYPYPAANPEVEASSIQQDLYRRDFTINALAVRLTQPKPGELLDFFGGILDLQAGQVRVLHANSFIEDPTRIYRAVRFAVRLGFQLEPQTERYIHHAIASGVYQRVHDHADPHFRAPALQTRLKAELKYILQAPYWEAALKLLDRLQALQCIHPSLEVNGALWRELHLVDRWLRRANQLATQAGSPDRVALPQPLNWLLRLEVILAHVAPEYRGAIAMAFQLPVDSIACLTQLAIAQTTITTQLPQMTLPSQKAQLLQHYDTPTLILVAIRGDRAVRRTIWQYFTQWATVKPPLDGNALKTLGYKPGPQFKAMLDQLTAATLDGVVRSRAEAEAFLQQSFPRTHTENTAKRPKSL